MFRGKSDFHVLLELPLAVVEGADVTRLEPARDAVEVEGVLVDASDRRWGRDRRRKVEEEGKGYYAA